MSATSSTRREFLTVGAFGAASLLSSAAPAEAAGKAGGGKRRLKLGLPTYMFKHYDLDQTLAMANRLDVGAICLRSNLLALTATKQQIATARAKVLKAGVTIYGGGVIYMRTEAQVHSGIEHARAAGYSLISVNVAPDLLGLLEKKVKQFDIRAAIHNHGPEDKNYPTPLEIHAKIARLDRRIGICHDTGHTMRAGVDPAEATLKTGERILDVHLKDVDAATREGHSTELGRGVVDLPAVLRAMRRTGYAGVVGIEYERDMKDLLPGLAESVGYVRGLMDGLV